MRRRKQALDVDRRWLVDSFEYREFEGSDGVFVGEERYSVPVVIKNVRIDYSKVYSRDRTEAKVVANAIIFCYASDTTPFLDYKERSRVTMDGKDYVIKKVIPNKEPHSNDLWSIELEVI